MYITDFYSYALFSIYLGFFPHTGKHSVKNCYPSKFSFPITNRHLRIEHFIYQVRIIFVQGFAFTCLEFHQPLLLATVSFGSLNLCMIILNNLVSWTNFVMAFSQITYEYAGKQKNVDFPCGLFLCCENFPFILTFFLSFKQLFIYRKVFSPISWLYIFL